ncbi:MAG: nucleoside triphosphate pyrophosphohydrolase [Ignavibacteriales bacterium]|nr:nucleoside triphosphate pyrophosphohydrolase [Ignavibacteriota bacterium]MCB9247312.1 nucleoside triphosphate pyrophosphohydrolase [Ignavibacteriales bacterium]
MHKEKFDELIKIMRRLRTECSWDKVQTFDSIKAATLEETYEVLEAIDDKNYEELKSELGDLLLHIVFHSVIAEDENLFTINDVIDSISQKLIRRHPHVFENLEVENNKEIERNWEKIKMQEGNRKSILDGIPKNLPELQKAARMQEKVSKVGFDWENKEDVWKKVIEEIEEMHESEVIGDKDLLENEMGDVFFALINYSRFLGVNPENALRRTNKKFLQRFNYIEQKLGEKNKSITNSNLQEMDKYWEESKKYFK